MADRNFETCVSVQEMAGQDYGAERGEAKEDKPENAVDEAEEDRADAVWDETNSDHQRGKPARLAGGDHQKSPARGASAQDRMSEGEPVGGNAHPVNYG